MCLDAGAAAKTGWHNEEMAGGQLVIISMKILIVISINIEPLELRAVQPGGVLLEPGACH